MPLAADVGLELPIRCARAQIALFDRPYALPGHLTVIDAENRSYFRPAAEGCTLVGSRTSTRQWLEDSDRCPPVSDPEFVEEASERIGARVPALRGAPYRAGGAGVVDITPDFRPIVGPEGLYLSVG